MGDYAWVRNLRAVFPDHKGRYLSTSRPWPSEPIKWLVWLASPPVEAWCPTADEQDARYLEDTANDRAQAQRHMAALAR